jgi:hypothetical protein
MRISKLLSTALVVLSSLPALATTYYVSPSGNDLFPGNLTFLPWKTIAHVNSVNLNAGDSVLFLAGGVWREELIASHNGVTYGAYGTGARPVISGSNIYNTGWTAASGLTNVWTVSIGGYQPEQVWFNTVLGKPVNSTSAIIAPNQWFYQAGSLYVYSTSDPGTAFTAPGIEAAQRDVAALIQASNITVSGLAFMNPNYKAIDVATTASGTQTFTNVLWQGAQYEGLLVENGAAQITNSKGLYNEVGIGVAGGSGVVVNNSILSGNTDGGMELYGTSGASSIVQSTISGNSTAHPLSETLRNYSPLALTASHSILLPNPTNNIRTTYIGVTDDGTNVNTSPAFTRRAAPIYIVPFIDDYNNIGVAQSVSALAHQYGCTMSYALNTKLVTQAAWQQIAAMVQAGDEIVAHTRSHADLGDPFVFTMQYKGTAATTATMSINTSTGRLQTFLNGSSTPDLNVDISNTYNGMTDICSIVNANTSYSCVPDDQQNFFTPAELESVANVNILQPYHAAASSDFYNFEINGSKADIEANLPGYVVKSFATPFTSSTPAVEDFVKNAGFQAQRNGVLDENDQPNGNWLLSSLDIYNLGAMWIPSQFDVTKPASSAAAMIEGLGANGGIIGVYSHGVDETTLASWQTLFQNLQQFGASCMTMSQATDYIKQNGTLVQDGTGKNWVRSVQFSPDFSNTPASPTQGAHGLQ